MLRTSLLPGTTEIVIEASKLRLLSVGHMINHKAEYADKWAFHDETFFLPVLLICFGTRVGHGIVYTINYLGCLNHLREGGLGDAP